MDKYAAAVHRYFLELKDSQLKETPRREKFLVLLKELFPTSYDEIAKYTDGAEKSVGIKGTGNEIIKIGRIDAYFGDLIIEFERSMPARRDEAKRQLREYCSGLWNVDKVRRPYICIATDGITWYTWAPFAEKEGELFPEDVELKDREVLVLTGDPRSCADFFLFINRLFFREGQLSPTVESFRKDFGLSGYLFEGVQRELLAAFTAIKAEREIEVSYDEWSRYLTYTYGSVATNEALFCKHTYLSVLARFIVWAALSHGQGGISPPSVELIDSLIGGKYFESIGILNLAEKDFFHWVAHSGAKNRLEGVWLKVLNQLRTYSFEEIAEDLLKGVYQELVDPSDRHDLGEYYTPDWLCEKVVTHLMGKPSGKIPSVIDLTCGSGSFIRAAIHRIRHLLEGMSENLKWESVLSAILANVHGIDIHPLAVIISKANYVLAIRELLPYRKKPIQIPVYLADALFMPQTDDIVMYQRKNVIVTFSAEKYVFPHTLFSDSQAWDNAIVLCAEAATNLALDEKAETLEGFRISLLRTIPHVTDAGERDAAVRELFRLTRTLAAKIREKRNTIWSYILRNNFRPLFLHGSYDVIIGNPPWLSLRYISDPAYQEEIKNLSVKVYGIAPTKQKLVTQMELATLFLVHATHKYLRKGGMLGYVMPRSIFSGDQHEKFRAETFDAECDIQEYWDLAGVSPLFNVPACVVFSCNAKPARNSSYPALFIEGRLPEKDLPLARAQPLLKEEKGKLYLSRMGDRSALSRTKIEYVERATWYKDKFSQGATIVPRNFYFIVAPTANELKAEEFFARTDPEQAKEGKPPYKDIFFEGTVETRYVFRTALSKNVLPFHVGDLPYVLLPIVKEGDRFVMKTAAELRATGDRKAAEWFQRAEKEWNAHREEKAAKQDLYERLNYQNGLTMQNPAAEYVVLYNTSGMNVSAATLEPTSYGQKFVADAKTYWAVLQSKVEACFLIAILNSEKVNSIVKPFQSRGLMGERDIHKKILEIPIPQFNKSDKSHMRLADIGESASQKVEEFAKSGALVGTLAKRRGMVRELLAAQLGEIDGLVEKLLD